MATTTSLKKAQLEGTLLTPIKAIRAKCLDCCCDQTKEIRLCPNKDCPLYPYRMGHRPRSE